MKRIYGLFALAAIGVALGSPAHGSPITLSAAPDGSGLTAGFIPGDEVNDFVGVLFDGPQIGGYFGAQIELEILRPSLLVIDFFGGEAKYANSFVYDGNPIFTHSGDPILNIAQSLTSPLAPSFATALTGGSFLLPFRFTVNGGADAVANGSNPDDSAGEAAGPNFFASCDPFHADAGAGGTNCSSVYLFLDDFGGEPDDDHDDFLVRVSVTPVPEPATILLTSVGFGFLAARRLKSRR